VLQKAIRQAARAPSFKEAAADLQELAGITISATHLQRLSERIGTEWAQRRDRDRQAFQERHLARGYEKPPAAAAVMLDGGRYQSRAAAQGRGVTDPAWKETKVACCQTLSSKEQTTDPQPEPPRKFLEPAPVARLTAQMKARTAAGRSEKAALAPRRRRRRRSKKSRPRALVRTVVATPENQESFGWQVAAEVHRRGLDRAERKACVCDGSLGLWALFAMHLLPAGFIAILDFVHLLVYLYAAAGATRGKGTGAAWRLYERWLRWAWSGAVDRLLAGLRAAACQVGEPPAGVAEEDPRKIVADAVSYLENNRTRMDYPRYRRLGLPISSAPVESVIKQLNRRVKGSEKFWLKGGAEAVLQVRAAYLSEDGRAERYWAQPRPYARAAGQKRLRRAG
jgi:hypothetical protein